MPRVIYMPNSGKPVEQPKPIPPILLAGGAGATAITGITVFKTWETLMTYKWVLLIGVVLVALIIYFAWKSLKSEGPKEDATEEE